MRIAVVVPVRDDAEALDRCLAAIDGQSRAADEVVVVDNGSSDRSAAVAVEHGARLVRTRSAGIPGATAAGFDAARSDVLGRLDADSVAPPDWLARIDAAFSADETLAAVSGAATFYDGSATVRYLGRLSLTLGYFRLIAGVIGHPPLYGSNFALRSTVWRRMSGSVHRGRADVHDDLDISLQLPPGVRVRYDPDLTVAVSARSFTRAGGTRRQVMMTARTLLATHHEHGLIRLRRAWRRADGSARAASRFEEGDHVAAEGVRRRLAGAVPAGVDPQRGAQIPGVPLVEPDRPDVALADGDEDRQPGQPDGRPDVGNMTEQPHRGDLRVHPGECEPTLDEALAAGRHVLDVVPDGPADDPGDHGRGEDGADRADRPGPPERVADEGRRGQQRQRRDELGTPNRDELRDDGLEGVTEQVHG